MQGLRPASFLSRSIRRFSASCIRQKIASPATKSQHLAHPQYNLKHLVANSQDYIISSTRRRLPAVAQSIPVIIDLYREANSCRARRTEIYTERKQLQGKIKKCSAENRAEILTRLMELKEIGTEIDDMIEGLEVKIRDLMDSVPNLLPTDCPVSEEYVVKYLCPPPPIGTAKVVDDNNFIVPIDYDEKRPDHVDIGTALGIIDLQTASKISGHAFYYLLGDGALLEQALVQFALSKARKKGFKVMLPPSVVRREYAMACGFRPRDADGERQIYNLTIAGGAAGDEFQEEGGLCLTGTAEIPLAGWASDRIFSAAELPLKVAGVSRSYRAEAGAHGRDTRGIYRVHEFTKVELFAWVPGRSESGESETLNTTTSEAMLEELRDLQEEIMSDLGLHCRVLNMPSTDLGASAYKKYDIEAWMPGRQGWGEVTSASNCTDYQARRLHTRVRNATQEISHAHTLNGTAMAVPRVIVAILENFYDAERQAIWIPKPLRRYLDDRVWIGKDDF
ncbi:uncharacterized protein V2V93DRAFT_266228 [Kockiozyma suomiensis]|uniref:uncharacterized protein n=1 Tax=Kockiozyma suomiensis TaxID=1337062 RepID=UPI00334371D6